MPADSKMLPTALIAAATSPQLYQTPSNSIKGSAGASPSTPSIRSRSFDKARPRNGFPKEAIFPVPRTKVN
jgi:hypothetical protein